jgi:hypothetical protein
VASAPDQTALRDRIADMLRPWLLGADEGDVEHAAEAVLAGLPAELLRAQAEAHQYRTALQGAARRAAVLPASVDRADVLREVAAGLERKASALTEGLHDLAMFVAKARIAEAEILDREADELRRVAAETPNITKGGPGWGIVQCSAATLNRPHGPHRWEPQPGMDRVRCPGACKCDHPADEHSVYGCADGCACEYLPPPAPLAGGVRQPSEADGDRVVAYRSALPGAWSIYCTGHTGELGDVLPLTSDDLPDGGLCVSCGVDVLIPQQPKEA